jgi:uncharacterized protein YgiM (DUF1202 family)
MQPGMDREKGMRPTGKVIGLAVLTLCVACVWGQSDSNAPRKALDSRFPFKAEVIGTEVNVRSGPGTDQYECGRVTLGDVVEVVGEAEGGWSEIKPLPSSFSWIAMQYISINFEEPTVGIVTGQGVNAYAGSDYRTPIRSKAKQVQLNRGDKVILLSEADEEEGYYKIQPPKGSTLWISSRYLKRLDGSSPAPSVMTTSDMTIDDTGAESMTESMEANMEAMTVEDTNTPAMTAALKAYYECQAEVQTELGKPLLQQNYDSIKKSLAELQSQPETRAGQYADYLLKRIASYELAVTVGRQVEDQNKQLTQTRERIRKARTERLAQIKDLGRFAVVGTLKESSIYSDRTNGSQYRIVNDDDITLCYVKPMGDAQAKDLSTYFGRKVGLVGTIKPYLAVGGALVEFTQIEKLN